MIFTESTIKISNNSAKMDSTIVLYRGDKNIEIRFTILQSPFKYSNTVATNIIESTNASYGQLVIKTPNDKPPIFSEVSATKEGTILFTITKEMIDEIEEVGVYTFQIRLMDENKQSRVTIPPVENGIEIKEPIAIEDDNTTNVVGLAKANYAVATSSDVNTPTFDDNGKYNKTNWNDGDLITNVSLNKIEDGIYTTNENVTATKKYVDDNTVIHPLPIYKKSESPSMIMYMVNILDLKKLTTYGAIRDMDSTKYQQYRFIYPCDDGKNKTIISTADDINDTTFRVSHYNNSSTLSFNNINYTIDYTKHSTPTDVIVTESIQKYLGIYNTHEYTPEEDYHPATKKYVDDNKIAYTVSSKVLTTVPASSIKLNAPPIAVNNITLNKDRKYYIEFLGSKELCNAKIGENTTNELMCIIGDYVIQALSFSSNLMIGVHIAKPDITTTTFTDLVIYEEEIECLDNKYLENDLRVQNSISLGRVEDTGAASSAVGMEVQASGTAAHAEGYGVRAAGNFSHAEGSFTGALKEDSHAEGYSTIAASMYQHVQGKNNIEDNLDKYAHIVGNGEDENSRANAHTLDWEGNAWFAGKLSQEGTPTEDKDLATKKYVDDKVSSLPQISFNENGELVVTINGVSKTFVPKNV